LNLISSGNFAISLAFGSSMQQLWGMIRALQMIVLCHLVRVPTPSIAYMFFSGCMLFAQMDVLDGKEFYTKWFSFKKTAPLNSNFELFDIRNKNFIINSGSYFIIFVGVGMFTIVKFLINKIAVRFAKYETARIIGMKVFSHSKWKDFKMAGLKLFMESYFDLGMCSLLNMFAFVEII
jgi:hypothetical protein